MKIGKVFTKNPVCQDGPRVMNLQSREKLCHSVITKLIWTQSWAKVRSLPRTHLLRNRADTIAMFVTVLSKTPSISSITSMAKKHQRNLGMSMRIERSSVDQVKARFALNKKKLEEKKKEYDLEQKTSELREEEEKLREYRREKKKQKKRKLDDDHHSGGDPDMMAMMGFGGFGGSKKN